MSNFRIINRRDGDDDGCGSGCGDCGGACNTSRLIQNPIEDIDEDLLFKPGTMVRSKLTGEELMILKAEPDSPVSYLCRTPKYEMIRMFDFELNGQHG